MRFAPLSTDRLVIRPFEPDDADDLWRRRNDPDVARYQDWDTPARRADVDRLVGELAAAEGPAEGRWWMAVVADRSTREQLGDVVVHLTQGGRTAEVGYSFWPRHWGRGYAVEALAALIQWLYSDRATTRVFGMLDPANPASAMVLERCGLRFEGHTRSSFWKGGEVSDDWIYGMTRAEWGAWRDRPRSPPAVVRFVEVTANNVGDVAGLRTHKTQEAFVATMAESFADALFPEVVDGAPVVPWMRAVEADGTLAAFVMLALRTEHHPEPFLWRLLVDRRHQRRGIGGRVLEMVAGECRARGDRSLLTSWSEGKGSPRPFYLARGFAPTGREVDGETEARWQF